MTTAEEVLQMLDDGHPLAECIISAREILRNTTETGEATSGYMDYNHKLKSYMAGDFIAWVGQSDGHPFFTRK